MNTDLSSLNELPADPRPAMITTPGSHLKNVILSGATLHGTPWHRTGVLR